MVGLQCRCCDPAIHSCSPSCVVNTSRILGQAQAGPAAPQGNPYLQEQDCGGSEGLHHVPGVGS